MLSPVTKAGRSSFANPGNNYAKWLHTQVHELLEKMPQTGHKLPLLLFFVVLFPLV